MKPRSHALLLSAALFALAASVASACGADPPLGRPDDLNPDGGVDATGAGNDGAVHADSATDGSSQSDTGDGAAGEAGDDALGDVVNPYQDAFEMYDAASDTAIMTEGDSGSPADGSGIHDGAGALPDGPMMVGD